MKKNRIFLPLVMTVCVLIPCSFVYADPESGPDNVDKGQVMKSYGNIVYKDDNGMVNICSDDLTFLAEKLSSIPETAFEPAAFATPGNTAAAAALLVYELDQARAEDVIEEEAGIVYEGNFTVYETGSCEEDEAYLTDYEFYQVVEAADPEEEIEDEEDLEGSIEEKTETPGETVIEEEEEEDNAEGDEDNQQDEDSAAIDKKDPAAADPDEKDTSNSENDQESVSSNSIGSMKKDAKNNGRTEESGEQEE